MRLIGYFRADGGHDNGSNYAKRNRWAQLRRCASPRGGRRRLDRLSAREVVASGVRRPYDSERHLQVFEKSSRCPVGADARWLTMLPG